MESHVVDSVLALVAFVFLVFSWSKLVSLILVGLIFIHSVAHVNKMCKCHESNTCLKRVLSKKKKKKSKK